MKAVVFNLHGVGTPERLLQFIDKLETYKKELEQLFRESNSNNFHFDNTYIPNYNGLQNHCIVMQLEVKRLGESLVQKDDLRKVLTENADRIKNCSLDKEIYQPLMIILPTPETFVEFKYEPSASGNRRASSRRGNPFENENKDYRTMPAMELIDWLKTAPSYKKSEVLKTMLLEPIDPDNRKLYLHVCGMFMDDPDMQHNKDDVFKLFRKWANTQGDKEKFGKHAEELLKHHSTRDTAMRWFGENKVISASKEVALYLKESRFDKNDAADALIAMGSGAEPAVIPYLNALEPKTRHLAIEILARIGTRECMPALRKLLNDNNNSLAAKQALVIIDKRHPEK